HLTTSTHTTSFAHNGLLESVYSDTNRMFSLGESVLAVGIDGELYWSSNLRMFYGSRMTAAHSSVAPSIHELLDRPAPFFTSITSTRRTLIGEPRARVVEEGGSSKLVFEL